MDWYAHSGTGPHKGDWQGLKEHVLGVATLAASMGRPMGLERAAFVAGLFHDLGKYNSQFQRRLEGADIKVDHSTAGAQILQQMVSGDDRAIAQIVGYSILGHHAGLPDRSGETDGSFDRRMERPLQIDEAWRQEITEDVSGLVPQMMRNLPKDRDEAAFAVAFMGRMIFSCLVDADYLDTERFYASLGEVQADRDWASLPGLLDEFSTRFDARISSFGEPGRDLDRMRADILAHVRRGAQAKPGLFTLTVPTGGGKTLASLGFALDHARLHGHSRIIAAIPFAGAWIETADDVWPIVWPDSRSPRGSVDRNAAGTVTRFVQASPPPLAGAWMEMLLIKLGGVGCSGTTSHSEKIAPSNIGIGHQALNVARQLG